MRRIGIMAGAVALLFPIMAQAQGIAQVGDRVKVTLRHRDTPVVGSIFRITESGFVLRSDKGRDSIIVPFSDMARLDRSMGRSATWGGILARSGGGAAFGALSGALVGPIVMNRDCLAIKKTPEHMGGCLIGLGNSGQRATAAVVGGVAGTVIGGVVGALTRQERWEQIEARRFPVRIALPDQGGVTLGLSYRF
ncbi:MAG: hypothetical protein A2W29_06365 [Gemmatimonadetes bacterium RBG_16_66_8]|nr:MAG: hypothetical protein A2W29_06365 [Gemmatimonadetes bacterium RBG_16_66_8]